MGCARRINPVSQNEFFELNSKKCTKEELAKQVYLMIHTYYLKEGSNIKSEMNKIWSTVFGVDMTEESYEYLLINSPVMLRDTIIDQTKQNKEIVSPRYLEKSIVAFEFDLWMLERYQRGQPLELAIFEAFLADKYGRYPEVKYKSFKKFDLCYISEFEDLAKELLPYYNKILDIFNRIVSNNRMRIEMDHPSVERTKEYKNIKTAAALPLHSNDREYQIIIKEKEERIEKLEKDIKEFKRQRDESREYSANQYDRGIKDLFSALNDIRYGKIIDYFYMLLRADDTNDNLASYLDNFFMALEDMEIEPIVSDGCACVKEDNMIKQFNLDFNKSEYEESKIQLKYAGWKYKDHPLEKPTLTLKER